MTRFFYKARDKYGKMKTGFLSADSPDGVAQQLERESFLPIQITAAEKSPLFAGRAWQFKKVTFEDLNLFTRELYVLQKAGLPLLSGLNALRHQTENPLLKEALATVLKDIEGGAKFSEALARHPRIFNTLYVNVIKAGEISGRLVESLERLAVLGEHDEKIRLRLKAAVRYPMIVVAAMVLGFIVLVSFVVPRFAQLYSKHHTDLPWPTQVLLGINFLVMKMGWLLILTIGGGGFLFYQWLKSPAGRGWWDRLQLRIPVLGDVFVKIVMSRFSRLTGMLLKSGIPILTIFDLVEEGVGNTVVAATLRTIKQSVNEGKGMLVPMKESGFFPPVVTQMVAIGEETGDLDGLLLHVADYYDFQVDYKISNLISLVEPILILFLGGCVLFMALAIFLPMWNMMNLFKH